VREDFLSRALVQFALSRRIGNLQVAAIIPHQARRTYPTVVRNEPNYVMHVVLFLRWGIGVDWVSSYETGLP
jgi:hypothetical protein